LVINTDQGTVHAVNEAKQSESDTSKASRLVGSALFSGTGTFVTQKRLTDKKEQPRRERLQAANALAKLRFNIGLEKAKRTEILKQIEEQEVLELKERRLQAEAHQRKSALQQATEVNIKMHSDVNAKVKQEKDEKMREKDNLQTSLKSKKEDDANENFRFNQRQMKLKDAFTANFQDFQNAVQVSSINRHMRLQDEQKWLQQLSDIQRDESSYIERQRK